MYKIRGISEFKFFSCFFPDWTFISFDIYLIFHVFDFSLQFESTRTDFILVKKAVKYGTWIFTVCQPFMR